MKHFSLFYFLLLFVLFFFEMSSAVSSGLQQTIEERIASYKAAILNAKEAGVSAKVRRYERGLKVCWVLWPQIPIPSVGMERFCYKQAWSLSPS